jgi:hypothetical protein
MGASDRSHEHDPQGSQTDYSAEEGQDLRDQDGHHGHAEADTQ